ncbi:MAG: bifunctional oligoribonuclease/PAP phosphatase NrnA [Endomicrobiaceae bacterium]|nr:bifunctional oligoribonuclease/PAP phosphatase NrnA [Endomicrobiaceae bacterium]
MKIINLQNSSKKQVLKSIVSVIKKSKSFFIAGHMRPDGDTIGSGLALASMLRRLGKKVVHCSADKIQSDLLFMSGAKKIKIISKIDNNFDCAIILESINFNRIGDIISSAQAKIIINIDHHLAHTNFGHINYVVPTSSSVAELIHDVFVSAKMIPTTKEAENLYVGIVTDTGRFQQINTNANSHLITAKLLKCGVNSSDICKKLFLKKPISKLKLYGMALSNLRTEINERFVYVKLTKDMFKKTKASDFEADGIINYCISVPTAVVGCVIKEIDDKTTKISLRSIEKFNVLSVVNQFDGGGHKNAAGCTINENIDVATKIIIKAFRNKLSAK